jgi:hypothetical protein
MCVCNQKYNDISSQVIFGAFDLYPPKKQMSMPGKVYIRYLSPIDPSEAQSRDEMQRLLRRRMLDAWKDCPPDICKELSFPKRYLQFEILYYRSLLFYI